MTELPANMSHFHECICFRTKGIEVLVGFMFRVMMDNDDDDDDDDDTELLVLGAQKILRTFRCASSEG